MGRKNIPVNDSGKNLDSVGGRIYFERAKLGKTLVDFALQCGVTKQTQIKYEGNQNFPDTRYLEGAMRQGADVMYILTGYRSHDALSDTHQNLIEAFEAAPEELKNAAFAVLLSPFKKELLRKVIDTPGYFQHQILGEEDARFEAHHAKRRAEQAEAPAKVVRELTPDQVAMLDNYDNCTPEGQATLRETGAALEKPVGDDGEAHCA